MAMWGNQTYQRFEATAVGFETGSNASCSVWCASCGVCRAIAGINDIGLVCAYLVNYFVMLLDSPLYH